MAKETKIQWTNYSINFWSGCTKVSPGCANCYAESFSKRNPKTFGKWGAGAPRNWHGKRARATLLTLNKAAQKLGTRYKVFPNSMSDWLDKEVPIEWLAHMLETIHMTPHLDYQLLTKRPENWEGRVTSAKTHLRDNNQQGDPMRTSAWSTLSTWLLGDPPHNIWIGTTIEDQKRAEERIPILALIPARVRFLSCEPLLGPVNIASYLFTKPQSRYCEECMDPATTPCDGSPCRWKPIQWVICGGESYPNARPMHPDWPRSLRDQCAVADIPFFFKQWGEHSPSAPLNTKGQFDFSHCVIVANDGTAYQPGDITYPNGPRYGEAIRKGHDKAHLCNMHKIGKEKSGHELDGVIHQNFPTLA